MRVMGLDLALRASGITHPDGTLDTITMRPGVTGVIRLRALRDTILGLAVAERVDLVAIEGYAYDRHNSAHQLGELGGVIRLALTEQGLGIPYVEVAPSSLKRYATGRGNASKDQVLVAAVKRLDVEPADNNQADAAWLRAMTLDHYGQPLVTMPASHRAALDAITWPTLEPAAVTP